MKSKTIFSALVSGLVLFNCGIGNLAIAAQDDPIHSSGAHGDKIIAIVNDDIITQSEVQLKMNAIRQQMTAAGVPAPSEGELRKKVLDTIIDQDLQLQVAKRANVTVPDKDVDAAISDIAARNHATLEQMKQELQREGIGFKKFRDQIKSDMVLNRVEQGAVGKNIKITDADVQEFMRHPPKLPNDMAAATQAAGKEYHVVDIFVHLEDNASTTQMQAAKIKAQDTLTKIKKGADLTQLVDGDKALTNNDLGWRKLKDMPDIFIGHVAKMKVNDIDGVIEAPNGFHIIKLLEVRGGESGAGQSGLGHLTPTEARSMLFHQKVMEEVKNWVKTLRATAYIKIIED